MEKYVIQEKQRNSPGIVFYQSLNKLEITGRAIPENPDLLFKQINDWISGHLGSNDGLNISFQLEYINSGSSKYLFETLKSMADARRSGKKIMIKWLFDEDDEAMRELGEHYRDTSGIPLKIEMII
jgi:hypothetical protein